MTDSTRSSMIATLAEISAKPSTPGREKAKANIKAALAKEFDHAAKAPKGGSVARAVTVYDREQLMTLADSDRHNAQVRGWARGRARRRSVISCSS